MKKIMMTLVALVMAISANAQYLNDSEKVFSQGKFYVGASTSGAALSYHKASDWNLNLQAKAGYLLADDVMFVGQLGYEAQTDFDDIIQIGAGLRYYFESCGVYAGAMAKYVKCGDFSDFRPELNLGYAYFLTGKLTIEPEVFYEHSTKSSDYSGFGLRIGFGVYF